MSRKRAAFAAILVVTIIAMGFSLLTQERGTEPVQVVPTQRQVAKQEKDEPLTVQAEVEREFERPPSQPPQTHTRPSQTTTWGSLTERHEEFERLAKEQTLVRKIRVDTKGSVTFDLRPEDMDSLDHTAEELARLYFQQVPEAEMVATGIFRGGRIVGSKRFRRSEVGM